MYLKFYGLAEKPFSQTPDPKFLYWNEAYRETIASLRYGISERKGFVTMIGEAGTGKTTLLRKLLDDLGTDVVSVFLFNPNASFEEILEYTLSELGIPAASGRKLAMLQRLNDFLLAAFNEGKNTILLIDEAQDLETEVLESLRLLSNLETAKEKILQIVLSGQPELAARLAQPNLRQLKQRIAVRCRIEPLGRDELAQYLAARLSVAGGRPDLFQPETLEPIWGFARGIPRLINTVCDNALLVGYALGRQTIDRDVIAEVVSDLERIDLPFASSAVGPTAAEPVGVPAPAVAPAVAPTPPAEPPPAAQPPASARAAPAPQTGATMAQESPAPASRPGPRPVHTAVPSPAQAEVVAAASANDSRRRRSGAWLGVTVMAVLALAFAAWAAGGWREVEPRVRRWLGDDQGRTAAPDGDASIAAAGIPREQPPPDRLAGEEPETGFPPAMPDPPAPAVREVPEPVEGAATDGDVAVAEAAAGSGLAALDAGSRASDAAAADAPLTPPAAAVDAPAEGANGAAEAGLNAAGAAPAEAAGVAPADAQRLAALPPDPEPAGPRASSQDLQATKRAVKPAGKRVLVQRGDTLLNLATREYGFANYTTLDVLRVVNPDIKDVNKIIAGSEILFPDPGPGARVLDDRGRLSVLVATTPILVQAREIQRSIGSRFRLPAELEPIPLGGGRNLYRVSLRQLPDRTRALQVAESLGTILKDPS